MGVLSWWGLAIPKFSAPPNGETMRQTPKSFQGARTCSGSSTPCQVWWGLDFTRRRDGEKRWVFCLSVCSSCFWMSEFVRQISPWRHWSTETILIPLDRGRFAVVHPCSTFSDCCQLATQLNAEVKKTAKIGVFAATGRQNKLIETKFGT